MFHGGYGISFERGNVAIRPILNVPSVGLRIYTKGVVVVGVGRFQSARSKEVRYNRRNFVFRIVHDVGGPIGFVDEGCN